MGNFRQFLSRYWWVALALLVVGMIVVLTTTAPQSSPPMITPVITLEGSPAAISPETEATLLMIHATATPKPSPTPWQIATPTTAPINLTPKAILSVNPFTGQEIRDPSLLARKPVLVKLLNWPRSQRPLSQINQADLVFEYYAGHQTNQLAALFYSSDADQIGPLAPGRLVDARLTRHYQGDLVASTVDTMTKGVLDNTLPERVFYQGFTPCPGICTDPVAIGGQTFANTYAIREYAEDQRTPGSVPLFDSLKFANSLDTWDEDALRFTCLYADFSVMDWRFEAETGLYHLWQEVEDENGELLLQPAYDSDGNPVAFENLVFMMSNYIEYTTAIYDINLREGDPNQQAIFLRDGKLTYGTWFAETATDPFSFFVGGEPYPLKPGRSWITISSTFSRPEKVDEGEWDLWFKLR